MDYTKRIFDRMKLRKVQEFIVSGGEGLVHDDQSYCNRLKNDTKPIN